MTGETKIKHTEITIETHSVTIIRMRGGKTESAFCETCRENVQIFSPAQAALIFRVDAQFLATLCYSNQIHVVAENALCAGSLADYFKQNIRFLED